MNSALVMLVIVSGFAHADSYSKLKCKDSTGKSQFSGVIRTGLPVGQTRIASEMEIPYLSAVSSTPYAALPRPSLERFTGEVLPHCMGPYARVFEKKGPNMILCNSGQLQELFDFKGSDQEIFSVFNLPAQEAACSIILSGETLKRVPAAPR